MWIEPGTRVPGSAAIALSRLYRSSGLVVRARRPRRVIDGLVSYLSAHADPHPGLMRSVSAGLVGHGRAVLLPSWTIRSLELLQPPLERMGWQFVDSIWAGIDSSTAELVVRPNFVAVDNLALAEFDDVDREAAGPVQAGRYPIVRWIFPMRREATALPSKATAVAAAMGTMAKDTAEPPVLLRGVATVFEQATPSWIASTDPTTMAKDIVALVLTS